MIVAAMVRPAGADDWPGISGLLTSANLPTSDLSEVSVKDFVVAVDAGQVVGAIAVQHYGEHGLLRSLVVDAAWRGSGLGRSLVQAAEDRAKTAGLGSLTLLTQTAAAFFRALGYREITRGDAPSLVHNSPEFTHLCPGSSTCMTKSFNQTRSV